MVVNLLAFLVGIIIGMILADLLRTYGRR